jgi:hypothetical protein
MLGSLSEGQRDVAIGKRARECDRFGRGMIWARHDRQDEIKEREPYMYMLRYND